MCIRDRVFFAESMFSKSSNGSKIALIALMGILSLNKFLLLDVQFMTDHLKTLGAKEISRSLFLHLINGSHLNKVQFKKPNGLTVDKDLINQAEKNLLVGIREL